MRCDSVISILPGFAGDDLLPATAAAVREHVASCASCRASLGSLGRVTEGLASLAERELDPPPFLADSIIERIAEPRRHRLVPVPPVPPGELIRVVAENKDAIASAAGAAIVVAGAAWLVWRIADRKRGIPATSH